MQCQGQYLEAVDGKLTRDTSPTNRCRVATQGVGMSHSEWPFPQTNTEPLKGTWVCGRAINQKTNLEMSHKLIPTSHTHPLQRYPQTTAALLSLNHKSETRRLHTLDPPTTPQKKTLPDPRKGPCASKRLCTSRPVNRSFSKVSPWRPGPSPGIFN